MDEKEKISRKLRSMKKYVDFLREYKPTTKEELEKNDLVKAAIERNFQLAIESALDIGEVIISAEDFEKPEDYRDIILILGKQGVIPVEFAERFAKAAGFRNILVHMYEKVDVGKLHDYLQNNLEDFKEFARCIARYLEK
ncbi:MAG: DUF86 domain-containing protein [Euryarchaeota archaeon]|nr:DUF86 domain-containing protein [Euryarchaeota archaeon]MBU4492420.1 DUF86 domain-containing protein [Euryarchaeota archaeon]MCG2728423.1 DUF86 domain-containing protein [Candidatus Methanoperedenaceae archaeon]